jgi:peptidoglycan/xylan/chitin deacetylase (PgdA/CDA1 family)
VVDNNTDLLHQGFFHTVSEFKDHLSFLDQFRVLGLNELAHELSNPVASQSPAAVITFDDGFANNLIAAEVLADNKIPWCLFASTAPISSNQTIWPFEISLLLLQGQADQIEVFGNLWSLKTKEERTVADKTIRDFMKTLPFELRSQTQDDIRQQFPSEETHRLLNQFPSLKMLSWNELRQLSNDGVEIGSHGVNHEIQLACQSPALRQTELVESKATLEDQLGRPCHYFAFPNGNFCTESKKEVARAGYRLAFTIVQGSATSSSNPLLLPRMNPWRSIKRFSEDFHLVKR